MMVSGLFLGRQVQLWEIALWVPLPIQLTRIVRRFERFIADPRVNVTALFHPIVLAAVGCLGHETAYLILDGSQAGKKCRSLVIGLAYHGTVLPLAWKTSRGKKGHRKGEFHRALLQQVYPYWRYHRRVIVLGDAEFSNEPVIGWLLQANWGFVLRFQHSYQLQTHPLAGWQSVQQLYQASQLQAGQVHHWSNLVYTYQHQIPGLRVTVYWGDQDPEPWCLVSNLAADQQPHLIYPQRFWIETLFGHHKSRGFQLARTHLTDPQHLDRLILALAIATDITLGLGTALIVSGQTKSIDRTDRRDLSLFQLGWRYLYRLLALDRLLELKFTFRWDIKLPPAGFRPSS
jgi:Transposase DDE domain